MKFLKTIINNKKKRIYSVEDLRRLTTDQIVSNIKSFLKEQLSLEEHSKGQIIAWEESINLLKGIFSKDNPNWKIIFEFPIPMSSGKRPDILLLNGVTVFLIEIKNKKQYTLADLNQIKGYDLDLTFYHSAAKNFKISPILILLKNNNLELEDDEILVVSKDKLKNILLKNYEEYLFVNPDSLFDGEFKPIPSITEYAKSVFQNTQIKNVEIPEIKASIELNEEILTIYNEVKNNNKKGIIFINGEAGTGKSAIGLSSAYNLNGLYVTKNRQFYEHLSNELGSHTNIKTSHNFVKEYLNNPKKPNWDVVIFDEAQRFFSDYKMRSYFNEDRSEQEVVLDFFSEKEWCLVIVLIGVGQEIGFGEYSDLDIWKKALNSSLSSWNVYGTKSTKKMLGHFYKSNFHERNKFDLYYSFRNLRSSSYPDFVNTLLDFEGDFQSIKFKKLKQEYDVLRGNGFNILITRKFDSSINYCKNRFGNTPNAFCTLSSSQGYIDYEQLNSENSELFKCGYENSVKIDVNDYLKNNALNSDNHYYSLTEYSSIGFEVEMPIVIWGFDFLWYKNCWNYDFERKITGGAYLRKNTYRVFLTRGRNGLVLFFPPTWEFDNTFNLFKELGVNVI